MKIIDLSHFIDNEMPFFPGTDKPQINIRYTIEKDGFTEKLLTVLSHTGTHIDSPAHILSEGKRLDHFDLDKFIGTGLVIDVSLNNGRIDINSLKSYESKISDCEFILLNTNWDKHWGTNQYYNNFPALTEEAAEYLTKFNLKGVGYDTISADLGDSTILPIHRILLTNELIIIENLTSLPKLIDKKFYLSILPLKIREADGSPVRATAMIF